MRSTPAGNRMPHRRGRASLTRFIALFILAGGMQAFTAAPAAAMDGVSDGTGCELRGGLPQGLGINEFGEVCILEIGGGGSGSGPLGVGYGGGGGGSVAPAPTTAPRPGWQPGEVTRIVQKRDPYCDIWPEHCWQTRNIRGSTGPLRQQANEKGQGRHETARGNPSQGKPASEPKGDPQKCAAITKAGSTTKVVDMKDRRIQRMEEFQQAAKKKLPKDQTKEEWFELWDDIDMYQREINRLRAEISAIHDARVQWYKQDCPGTPPWEKTEKGVR